MIPRMILQKLNKFVIAVNPFYSLLSLSIIQGYKWIRQWSINQYTSPMMIHKITPSVDYNQ